MICPNCQSNVDDDLIFCTNCGQRISGIGNQPTAANDSVATRISPPHKAKKSVAAKWIALIAALIAVPLIIFGVIMFVNLNRQTNVAENTAKPSATNRQPVSNKALKNVDANQSENSNINSNIKQSTKTDSPASEIFNQQIEIAPGEHMAYPFRLDSDTKITGDLQTVRGEPIHGFVYFQKEYDEHFPDATFKVFDFEGANPNVEQTLVAGDYVLVFLNPNPSSTTIKGKFTISPEDKAK